MKSLRPWMLVAALLAATSCSGGSEQQPDALVPEPPPAEAANPESPDVTKETLEKTAENVALVPSPMETQRALERTGVETELAALIQDREFDVSNTDVDNAAVRTGVVIADLLLTVKTSSNEDLLDRMEQVQKGMTQLDGGQDILRTIDDIKERVRADAVTRDELLKELDELSGAIIPELEFNGRERVVPLIQAGSWLEGANLLAKAVKAAGRPDAADGLLKQPSVVDYFLTYVRTKGAEQAPEAVTKKLEESLITLKGIANKSEPLDMEDIDNVIQTTDDVLALL
ncbi:MAG: hypothetical protein JRI25_08215 [Deltaproteobacteria bacterium]|nr:hypothetical protein [Deltaproteobacteria bacterium]MBW2254569.1 hypothetical protein [Deltaproteobacteria bacterium]